jgi:hypothetical protein
MDEALNFLLLNIQIPEVYDQAYNVFIDKWTKQADNEYKEVDLAKNKFILYSKYDFDPNFIEKKEWAELFRLVQNPIEYRDQIKEKLKTLDFKDLTEEEKEYYNYTSWLSIKNKAKLLIDEYIKRFLPEIDEVLEVQKKLEVDDGSGNKLTGVIDFICRLKDGRVAIIDNKTSSIEYDEEDSVTTSAQLALYKNVINNDPESKYKIDVCGYFVLSKKIEVETTKICKSCGFKGEGSHKTCNNEIDGKRCGGDWYKTKKYTVNTQMIINPISDHVQDMVVSNADEVKKCIEAELFPRNFGSCEGKFGRCEFYNLCYKNDKKDLIKLEDKK